MLCDIFMHNLHYCTYYVPEGVAVFATILDNIVTEHVAISVTMLDAIVYI